MSRRVAQSRVSASHINNNHLGAIMNHHIDLQVSSIKQKVKAAKKIGATAITTLAMLGVLGPTTPAAADDFSAGIACSFQLRYTATGGEHRVCRGFTDQNGNKVCLFSAGKGTTNTFTNLDTGASLTINPGGGSVSRTTINSDGTQTVVATGFNGLIFFPSDVPAGPSTTLYLGRVVYTVDPSTGVFTLLGSSGQKIDICAALSPTP